jgi:hypothetical protein
VAAKLSALPNPTISRPTGVRRRCCERQLTKTEEQETIIINRSGRSTYLGKKSVPTTGATPHLVARQLRKRHRDRATLIIADEYDVQDLLHALLRLEFDDVRPEENTPSYAGAELGWTFYKKTKLWS